MSRSCALIAIAGLVGVVVASMKADGMASSTAAQTVRTATASSAPVDVTVTEGTSMSVAVSPDGRTLAIDLQGSIWTLPATGGAATRITDLFDDARQPAWSPDGKWIAFFGYRDGGYDIWAIAPDGSNQHKLTWGPFDDREPVWSHDGTRLAFSSDRGDPLRSNYNIWMLDVRAGALRQLTTDPSEESMPSWSPDDKEIAFASTRDNGQAVWALSVADGGQRKVSSANGRADAPSWGPDGQVVYHVTASGESRLDAGGRSLTGSENVFAFRVSWASPTDFFYVSDGKIRKRTLGGEMRPVEFTATLQVTRPQYTRRARDFSSTAPRQALGIVRPVIAPDGTRVAFAAVGDIYVMPVGAEMAHAPSWAGDSRHILYQSMDKLRLIDIESGGVRDVPLDLKYTVDIPKGRIVVHAGTLVDMKSATPRSDVDIVIEGNRIRSVEPHASSRRAGAHVVDASNLTAMPGLVEFHSHLQKDFGEAQGRAWLAFGVTTVRSPGNTPYEAVEDREANEAGVRQGPRVYGTGYLMEWMRVYYKMGIAISSPGHFEMELQRAKVLQHDLIKSYVRLPDLQQRRMVEFAHSIGVPVATHEIYPASFVGVDNTEHTAATSRRGYSPKMATLQRSYGDVIQLFGKSGRIFCPMISGAGARKIFESEPELTNDPRFRLYPAWIRQQVAQQPAPAAPGGGGVPTGGSGKMVMEAMRAGALVVAATDTPNAINLHGELMAYTMAGMTPFEALKAATVNPAQALGLEAGTIEAGKLADIVIVEGNPLANVANAHHIKRVIANGRLYELEQLVNPPAAAKPTSAVGRP